MQTYRIIQKEIGAWSKKNFGDQETPYLEVYHCGTILKGAARTKGDEAGEMVPTEVVVALGSLAPLMGIMEELGELFESREDADREDALGDIAVYLCDYCCREGILWPVRIELPSNEKTDPTTGLVVYLAKLFRCHLKRHQRIRGMHEDVHFETSRMAALRALVWHLEEMAREWTPETNLTMILNETWNRIVSKRDWKADPTEGGGHTHEPPKEA